MKKIILGIFVFFLATVYVAFSLNVPREIAESQELQTAILDSVASEIPASPASSTAPPRLKDGSFLIPVIVYHRIGYAPKEATSVYKSLTIGPEWFEKHLQYLKENGFTTIHFQNIADFLDKGTPLPERPVLINFDDGYKNIYTNAWPILKKHGMTGTVFVVPNLVGKRAYMPWEHIQELSKNGVEIGSHTMWHPNLTKSKKVEWEVIESKKVLEEKLDMPITAFAYPEGKYNKSVEETVKAAGYTTGRSFTTGNGVSQENRFHIPVVRVYANVGLERWKSQLFP